MSIDFADDVPNRDMEDNLKLNIYRIIQEQLSIIVKYAAAKNVSIAIQEKGKSIQVEIGDDGKGFDVNKKRTGIGISNMFNRINSFNGEMFIDSSRETAAGLKFPFPNNILFRHMAEKHLTQGQIDGMEQRQRAQFINSLGGFKSLVLIGTANEEGRTNLAVFNSFFHIGANPPLCGTIFRPDTVSRHTLDNIQSTGIYTVNHVHSGIFKKAHQTSARYDRGISEFDATGLTAIYQGLSNAPYVGESHIRLGMELAQRVDLEINGTVLIIGRILEVFFPEDCIASDGFIDLERAGTLTVSGLDSYHATRRIARLTYAKPGSLPESLDEGEDSHF